MFGTVRGSEDTTDIYIHDNSVSVWFASADELILREISSMLSLFYSSSTWRKLKQALQNGLMYFYFYPRYLHVEKCIKKPGYKAILLP